MAIAERLSTLERLKQGKLVAILRGDYGNRWLEYAEALMAGGFTAMEITLNSVGAIDGIKTLKAKVGDRMVIGAGTVLTAEQAHQAIDAGAEFIVAPDTDESMIKVCTTLKIPVMPGGYTATEIKRAYNLGAAIVKVFPGPGPEYIKAIRGPLDYIPLMVTSGISLENIADYFKAGVCAAGLGSTLAKPGLSADELTSRATAYFAAIQGV